MVAESYAPTGATSCTVPRPYLSWLTLSPTASLSAGRPEPLDRGRREAPPVPPVDPPDVAP